MWLKSYFTNLTSTHYRSDSLKKRERKIELKSTCLSLKFFRDYPWHVSYNVSFEVQEIIKLYMCICMYIYTHFIGLRKIPAASKFGIFASQPYSVTISIFRSSCSFVRLESPVEISRRKRRHSCTCWHTCMCARHPLWPHSSFTRYLAFPFPLLRPVSVPPPSSSLQQPSATCTCVGGCVHVCVGQKRVRLVAVPCRCMQILSPNLVSARASVLRTKAKGREAEGGKG